MRLLRRVAATLALALLLAPLADAAPAPRPRVKKRGPKRVSLLELERLAAGSAHRRVVTGPVLDSPPTGMDWIELGPRPILADFWSGNRNAAGRVSSVVVDPRDADVAYLAAAQGGVWKTVDGGTTWTPKTEAQSSLASGSVTLDPSNPDVVYYGTGEQHYSNSSFYGDGLFRSEDGGETWAQVAPRSAVGSYIARVRVAPTDPNLLYVASSRGFVRSTDRGVSWTVTLAPEAQWCNDLVIDPVTPGVLLASIYARGVYRSTDFGATWTELGGGLPVAGFERINLALAPSSPNVALASFVDSTTNGLLGLWKTTNGGTTWSQLPGVPNYLGTQGWYDHFVAIAPNDPNRIYAGGVYPYEAGTYGIVRSTNGGGTWGDITFGSAGEKVHPDQHDLAFGPDGALWLANDGGVWRSLNGGTNWINCNGTLGITQFYTVAKHPTDPDGLIGGTQDNGTVRFAGSLVWPQVIAGDGGPAVYRPDSPSIYYTTYVRMNPVYKWTLPSSYLGEVTGPWDAAADRADWANGPLIADPVLPNTLLAGTYRVWRTTNGGGAWTALSGDLTAGGVLRALAVPPGTPDTIWAATSDGLVWVTVDAANWQLRSNGIPPGVRLPDLVLHPTGPDTAWVIADVSTGARVLRTDDHGLSWSSVTGALPAGLRALSLAVDWRFAVPRLYVGTDYGVYVSIDGGETWIHANSGMPDVAVLDLALDLYNGRLIAATHGRGMWRAAPDVEGPTLALVSPTGGESLPGGAPTSIAWTATDPAGVDSVAILLSTDGGASFDALLASGIPNTGSFAWTPPDTSLPSCRVRIVAWDAWRNETSAESESDFAITSLVAVDDRDPALVAGRFALARPWPNPAPGEARFRFVLPRASRVALDVFDLAGRRVRALVPAGAGAFEPGVHELRWDGRDGGNRPAPAGVYFVRMQAGGFTATERLVVVRGSASAD